MTSNETVVDNDLKPSLKLYVDEKFMEAINYQDQVRKDIQLHLNKIDNMLSEKVDMQALEDTHDKYSVLLEKFMNNCQKKFTDKQEAKKNFKLFERQLKNIFDIVISKFEEQDITDAMAAKKPLGGWSCISCQKGIVNLQGAISEYQVKGQFPWRDP